MWLLIGMAAGRVDIPRRNDVWKLNQGYSHAIPDKNGYNYPSNGKNLVSQHKNGSYLGNRRCGLEDFVRVKNDVITVSDDGVQQPPQKKRKFSPIVWEKKKRRKQEFRLGTEFYLHLPRCHLLLHLASCQIMFLIEMLRSN